MRNNKEYTEEEAKTLFANVALRALTPSEINGVIRTGIDNIYDIENFSYPLRSILTVVERDIRTINERANSNDTHGRHARLPTTFDYNLREARNPLKRKFEKAWIRFDRSR